MFDKLKKSLGRTQPEPSPSFVVTTRIDNPRLLEASVDTSTSPSTISGKFGIDITNTGILATRSLRITKAKIELIKNDQSLNIGEIKKPQQIKDIPSGETKTVKINFEKKSNFINQIGEDICNIKEITSNMSITVAEIILAATYSNKKKIKVKQTDCNLITVNIQGQQNVNVNQKYAWKIAASDGSQLSGVNWDMGDGTTKSGTEVSHTYDREGVFDITAETDGGNSDNIEVNAERLPLAIVGPTNVEVGKDNTWEPSGQNLENLSGFSWSMGDGTVIEGDSASHSYNSEGEYTMRLTSDEGTSTSITIQSSFPNITIDRVNGNQQLQRGNSYTWTITGNNLSEADEIRWDMGDGQVLYGREVTHTYQSAADHTITASVRVADQQVTSATLDVQIEPFDL